MFYKILNLYFFYEFDWLQIKTFTLDPSLIGLITTGNPNFFLIIFLSSRFDLSKLYLKYLGVNILFFIKIFFDFFVHSFVQKQLHLSEYKVYLCFLK